MEDHVKRKLGGEEGEEPLRGVHVSLQTHIQEMVVQVWDIFLFQTETIKHGRTMVRESSNRKRKKKERQQR